VSNPDIYKQIDARYGRMLFNPNDRYIGRGLDLYGEFSEGEVELFRQIIKPNSIVLDIGANIGCHTVFMAKAMENTGRIIAFEPQRLLFQLLCANVALNNLFNVQCLNEAVGDSEDTVLVPFLHPADKLSFGSLELGGHEEGEVVQKITIDSLNLPQCQFIKLDVEGMEAVALAGARDTITRCKPVLYVENDREENSDDLIRLIALFGYRMYWHLTPLYNPDNFKKNPENVFEGIISKNMFCVPEDSKINVTHMEEVEVPVKP